MMNLDACARLLAKLNIRHRETGAAVPFRLNPNQATALERLKEQASRNKPLRWICVKSRRVGMSSLTEGLLFCYNLANPNIDSRIVAHLDDSVDKLFSIPVSLTNDLRRRYPDIIGKPTADRILFPHDQGRSLLDISTARTAAGGRGAGFHALHLSEAAQFPNTESLLSLLNAVPNHPNTLICIESTAFGRVGIGQPFYDRWTAAVSGESEYIPVFLSWKDDPACVADPEILKRRALDKAERELAKQFKLTPEQLAWRRITIADNCDRSVDRFRQEFPLYAEESFLFSGTPAFQLEELQYADSTCDKPIYQGFVEREGKEVVFTEGSGNLLVWEKPKPTHAYYIGVDAAGGTPDTITGKLEGDFAAVVVWNGTTGEQAARYAAQIGPEALAYVVDKVGRYFNNAMVNVERTGGWGAWSLTQLRDKLRYPNLANWKGNDDKRQAKQGVSLGFDTTHRTRELMFAAFRAALRDKRVTVKDQGLVSQMGAAERLMGQRWEVRKGHDDILLAALMGWLTIEQFPPANAGRHKRPQDTDEEQEGKLPMSFKPDHTQALKRNIDRLKQYESRKKLTGTRLDGV